MKNYLRHSPNIINKIKESRKKGYSISELMKEFSIPKTTIWHYIQGINLSKKQTAYIRSKQGGSKIRSQNDWDKANKHSKDILNSKNKFFYSLLAMLYWAEGNKKGFVFTNTDGQMIKLFLVILKKYFNIDDNKINLIIRIFSNLNKNKCIKYWTDITGFSKNKIKVYLNDGATKGKAKYGICRLSVKKSGYLYKLTNSLINNIVQEITEENI